MELYELIARWSIGIEFAFTHVDDLAQEMGDEHSDRCGSLPKPTAVRSVRSHQFELEIRCQECRKRLDGLIR